MDRAVGIVIPAYEPDVEHLSSYVRELDEQLAPASIRIELDAAEPDVAGLLRDLPAVINAVPTRRGKGRAITEGFEQLETDILAFADADGSTPAGSIADVIDPLLAGRADLSVGSRRHPEAVIASHQTYARRRLGDAFARFARWLIEAKLYDYQCGAKALTRETWHAVREHLYEPGFAWDVELIAMTAAFDRRICEVPVTWDDRPNSTVSPVRGSLSLARGLFAARHRAKLLRNDRIHGAIAARRTRRPALINQVAPDADE